jgi:hypothetical protein
MQAHCSLRGTTWDFVYKVIIVNLPSSLCSHVLRRNNFLNSMKFSRADSLFKVWRFSELSVTNSVHIVPETSENLHILKRLSALRKLHWILWPPKVSRLINVYFIPPLFLLIPFWFTLVLREMPLCIYVLYFVRTDLAHASAYRHVSPAE